MKLHLKKYIYLINDVTNLILNKNLTEEAARAKENVRKLRLALITIASLLLISVIFNIYFLAE